MNRHYLTTTIVCAMLLLPATMAGKVAVTGLLTNRQAVPVAIPQGQPQFSWTIDSDKSDLRQTGFDIEVAATPADLKAGRTLWSEHFASDDMAVRYSGPQLKPGSDYCWRVRVTTDKGNSSWSKPQHFSTPIAPDAWQAQWIGLDSITNPGEGYDYHHARLAARYLRKPFTAGKEIKRATLSATGLGVYNAYVNGQRVSDEYYAPALTFPDNYVYFNTYDVTPLLRHGDNVLGVSLGSGRQFWPRNMMHFDGSCIGMPKMIARLDIEYTDGTTESVVSDSSWRVTAAGPIVANHEYDGEEYDARKEMPGWSAPGFDDSAWQSADVMDAPKGKLLPQPCPPMRPMHSITPKSVTRLKSGKILVDFGQNFAGVMRATIAGTPGHPVVMRFAETINPDSTLYTANLRHARATDIYTPASDATATWQPEFVIHGFRYAEIDGLDKTPSPSDIAGVVIYDDMPQTGTFSCSDPVINQVFNNCIWGIRSNYRNIPTDCPQRDERQGWLGDRTMNCWGETFLNDIQPLYSKWIADIEGTQRPDGSISEVSPQYWYCDARDVTWCGAFVYVTDMLLKNYGDTATVKAHYPALKRWTDFNINSYVRDGLHTNDCFGDWCLPPESPELIHSKDESRKPDKRILSTAMFNSVLKRMANFAHITGNDADAPRYLAVADSLADGLNRHLFNYEKGYYANNAVTGNLMPLFYGLVPKGYEQKVLDNIVHETEVKWDGHVSCGLVGVEYMLRTLTRNGRPDLALRLASNDTYPSLGYMARQGATTIWELWNGDTASPDMNSGNHVMMIGDFLIWCYEDLCGIRNAETPAAFRRVLMQPCFPEGLSHAEATYNSPSGRYDSRWKRSDKGIDWQVTVPANCSAEIHLPKSLFPATPRKEKGIRSVKANATDWIVDAGSGSYRFGK